MQQFVSTAVVVTSSECAWFRLPIGEPGALLAPIGTARPLESLRAALLAPLFVPASKPVFDPDQCRLTFYG